MKSRHSGRRSRLPVMESLETRALLSAGAAVEPGAMAGHGAAAEFARMAHHSAETSTLVRVQAGAIGQAVTITVYVRAAASQGSPTGTVTLSDHGTELSTLTLVPTASPSPRFAMSVATLTIPAGAGGPAFYFGPHAITAQFTSNAALRPSHGVGRFRVARPHFTHESGGLELASVNPGNGPTISAGQTAYVLYTGYLYRGGKIFDASYLHGGAPFSFVVDATPEQVIPGFDAAVTGMQLGETRVVVIPPALGYGRAGAPSSIPPNAKLVFLITLEGIG